MQFSRLPLGCRRTLWQRFLAHPPLHTLYAMVRKTERCLEELSPSLGNLTHGDVERSFRHGLPVVPRILEQELRSGVVLGPHSDLVEVDIVERIGILLGLGRICRIPQRQM